MTRWGCLMMKNTNKHYNKQFHGIIILRQRIKKNQINKTKMFHGDNLHDDRQLNYVIERHRSKKPKESSRNNIPAVWRRKQWQ